MVDREDTAKVGRRDWLAALLLRRHERFASRLLAAVAHWRGVRRGARRRLQGRAALATASAALLFGMVAGPLAPPARAAGISVGGACTLVDAIVAANTDTATGGCAAGSGADTLTLTGDVTLTTYSGYYYYGYTGLPLVTSAITIDGDGYAIERDGAAPAFRLLAVGANGDLTLTDVTLSGGDTGVNGGAIVAYSGSVSVIDSVISDNLAMRGAGLYVMYGTLDVSGSTIEGNTAGSWGGGISSYQASTTVVDTTVSGNEASYTGGGILNFYGTMDIVGSTIDNNTVDSAGGGIYNGHNGTLNVTNSTISDNEATSYIGGGVHTDYGAVTTLRHVTVTGNSSGYVGGGVYGWTGSTTTLIGSLVSGNSSPTGDEVGLGLGGLNYMYLGAGNVIGHDGITTAEALWNSMAYGSDVTATSDGTAPTALGDILDTTLAANGGPTLTHNLVSGSPALDVAAAGPSLDQRGYARPYGLGRDAGAVEYGASPPSYSIFASTTAAGVTDDALAFGPHDILMWNGSTWSKWFDGSAAGLTPNGGAKHNVNAFWIPDAAGDDVVMSFAHNSRRVLGVVGKVHGMDLVWWDGSAFSLWFDGQDVGLTTLSQEKIDALHVLDGALSPVGSACDYYLLLSTQGPGQVPGAGGPIRFSGEDVLGFCMTNSGSATTGFWHLALDGSSQGMPRNSLTGLSASDDGMTLYVTTRGAFDVDAASGSHSMIYKYDVATTTFSGPHFSAPDSGLHAQMDGMDVKGVLP